MDKLCESLNLTVRELAILTLGYYRWAMAFYIKDPFSQLQGNDIDG